MIIYKIGPCRTSSSFSVVLIFIAEANFPSPAPDKWNRR